MIVRRLDLCDARGPASAGLRHPPPAPPSPVPDRAIRRARLRVRTHGLPPRPPRESEPVNLREREEAASVDEEIVLSKARLGGHGCRGVRDDLQHVIPPHGPREVDDGATTRGIVHLLPVCQYQALPGRDAPHEGDVVFLPPAGGPGLPGCDGIGIREAEPPSHPPLRVGDALPARHGREVYGVEWTVGPAPDACAGTAGVGGVAGTTGGGGRGRHRGCGGQGRMTRGLSFSPFLSWLYFFVVFLLLCCKIESLGLVVGRVGSRGIFYRSNFFRGELGGGRANIPRCRDIRLTSIHHPASE